MQDVNVADVMSHAENREFIEKMEAALAQDAEAAAIMEKSNSVEDMFKVVSRYFKLKFEDFKEAYNKAVNYFTEPKTQLDDDVMDNIVGGGICDWFKKNWKTIASVAVTVAIVGVGVAMCATGVGLIGAGLVAEGIIGIGTGGLVGTMGVYTTAHVIGDAVKGKS